jgi:hypothetical protein
VVQPRQDRAPPAAGQSRHQTINRATSRRGRWHPGRDREPRLSRGMTPDARPSAAIRSGAFDRPSLGGKRPSRAVRIVGGTTRAASR